MRAKVAVATFCCYAVLSVMGGAPVLRAQTPGSPQQPTGPTGQDSANDLVVTVGQSVLVDTTQPIVRVAIGMGDIAEATATTPTEVMVNGKAPGVTSLIVWESGGGRQFFKVQVRASAYVEQDAMHGIERELHMELPGQHLQVSSEERIDFSARHGEGSEQLSASRPDCIHCRQGRQSFVCRCSSGEAADSFESPLCQC